MIPFTLLCLILTLLEQCNATRCFECQNVPYPRACARLSICSSDEYCFTEQIVTTSGSIVYNIGCIHKQRCSLIPNHLIGKRSNNATKRTNTDISTCLECCHGDFCNNQGCGTKAVPVEQRGPYCYKCDSLLNPKSCNNVAVCLQNELCLLYSPGEFVGLPEIIYKSKCGKQSECDVLPLSVSSSRCPPTCCDTDFCNDHCGFFQLNNRTHPTTTPPTEGTSHSQDVTTGTKETTGIPKTAISVQPAICNTSGGYVHLYNLEADLCVHIVKHHADWTDAQAACQKEGGDLVVLDTHEKALLLRHLLAGHSTYDHEAYWIGANTSPSSNQFAWINQLPVNISVADWDPGQPNSDNSHTGNCVCMYRNSHHKSNNFKWHDKSCGYRCNYICERL